MTKIHKAHLNKVWKAVEAIERARTKSDWHSSIEVLQDTLRTLEGENDRLKTEIARKETFKPNSRPSKTSKHRR